MRIITQSKIDNFKTYLKQEERSNATQEKYIRDITKFFLVSKNKEVSKEMVLNYKNTLVNKYKIATVNSIISSLNSFFIFNKWHDLKLKSLKCQRQPFANNRKMLTKNDYYKLLTTAKKNKRLYLVIQTICSTGIRVSELKYITVQSVKDKYSVINLKGKTRLVILPFSLCELLEKFIKDENIIEGSVFVSKNGNPLNRSNIWTDMKKLCLKAEIEEEKVYPHNLRHLFARTYYENEKDITMLADILGHSNINTTRIYTTENIETHRSKLEDLDLIF